MKVVGIAASRPPIKISTPRGKIDRISTGIIVNDATIISRTTAVLRFRADLTVLQRGGNTGIPSSVAGRLT
jgi:hypothetical protein